MFHIFKSECFCGILPQFKKTKQYNWVFHQHKQGLTPKRQSKKLLTFFIISSLIPPPGHSEAPNQHNIDIFRWFHVDCREL